MNERIKRYASENHHEEALSALQAREFGEDEDFIDEGENERVRRYLRDS